MTATTTVALDEAGLEAGQRSAMHNRPAIAGRCGCYPCRSVFEAEEIVDWIDAGQTALCPVCGVDAVLSASSVPVTPDILQRMHDRWFGGPATPA